MFRFVESITRAILPVMHWLHANSTLVATEGLKIIGIIAAALTVVFQLRRQHRNALDQQRQSAREALKLRVYESLLPRIRAASDAFGAASMYVFNLIPALNTRRDLAPQLQLPLQQRVPEFADLHFKAQKELAELLIDFESWSIAFPGLHIFKIALNAANFDVMQAFTPLSTALFGILPMGPPPGDTRPTIVHPLPSAEALAELQRMIETYKEAADDVQSYIFDLTVEAQNNLLYGLFDSRVPQRKPLDPRYKVISTDPEHASALILYFETETPWGKHQAFINADVLAAVQSRGITSGNTE